MKVEKYLHIYLKDTEKLLSLEGKPDHVKLVIIALQFYLEGRGEARKASLDLWCQESGEGRSYHFYP